MHSVTTCSALKQLGVRLSEKNWTSVVSNLPLTSPHTQEEASRSVDAAVRAVVLTGRTGDGDDPTILADTVCEGGVSVGRVAISESCLKQWVDGSSRRFVCVSDTRRLGSRKRPIDDVDEVQ